MARKPPTRLRRPPRAAPAGVIARTRELERQGYSRPRIRVLAEQGVLEQVSRGLYRVAERAPDEHFTMVAVVARVPQAVVCLLSALRYHEIGTQSPHEVWIAIDRKARKPRLTELPVRVVRFSGPALREGVESRMLGEREIRITSPARTVADCFKYRNKIGLDVALEALRDYLARHRGGADELWRYARLCRVARVMQPYLETVL
ncbi:MAG: type IV toxin-antitoxin system AbiEi family antitoxin domain-containing protein [Burkholderiales bacterium]